MKKLFAVFTAMALMLSFTPALAADVSDLFPAKTEYTGFSDVPDNAWYASAVKVCCETGLMQGTDNGFNPEGNLTVAEVVTIAARIYATLNGETVPASAEGAPWYEGAQTYLTGLGIYLPEEMTQEATRIYFIYLLSAVVPDELLPPINNITFIHDIAHKNIVAVYSEDILTGLDEYPISIKDENILAFYNAGILTGMDEYGTFRGYNTLTRAEVVAMLARLVRPNLRQSFTPAPSSLSEFYLGVPADTILLTVNDEPVTTEEYLSYFDEELFYIVFSIDEYEINDVNDLKYINFSSEYEGTDLGSYVKSIALSDVIFDALIDSTATSLGCDSYFKDIGAALYPHPSNTDLTSFVIENELYCYNTAYFSNFDEAENFLNQLHSDPTLFNTLISTANENNNLNSGYYYAEVFSRDMLPIYFDDSFASSIQVLPYNEVSDIFFHSDYGYYCVVQRVDPLTSSTLLSSYQEDAAYNFLVSQIQSANCQFTNLYDNINAQSYVQLLPSLPDFATIWGQG